MHNMVILTGRLTADPELCQIPNGTHVCNVNIAVERPYNKNKDDTDVDFIRIEFWKSTADFVSRNFRKGQLIEVVGSLRNRRWKNTDVTRYETYVRADNVNFAPINNSHKSSSGQDTNTSEDNFMSNFEPIGVDNQ